MANLHKKQAHSQGKSCCGRIGNDAAEHTNIKHRSCHGSNEAQYKHRERAYSPHVGPKRCAAMGTRELVIQLKKFKLTRALRAGRHETPNV